MLFYVKAQANVSEAIIIPPFLAKNFVANHVAKKQLPNPYRTNNGPCKK